MTTKEQLHHLIDELSDEQAPRALDLLKTVVAGQRGTYRPRRAPASVGAGLSGRGDVSERVDELLAEGFGR